jgi:phage terminase large subunit GpA-like protein
MDELANWTPRTIRGDKAAAFRVRLFNRIQPPASFRLTEWAESNIVLPAGQSARPGAFQTWPYLREIMVAMSAPDVEFVTVQKASRIGYTKSLMIAIAAQVSIDPCAIGLLTPTDDDARDYATDELEPLFEATPVLRSGPHPGPQYVNPQAFRRWRDAEDPFRARATETAAS